MTTTGELSADEIIPDEIRHACLVRASRMDCFRMLTTVEGWNAWFTTGMHLDLKPGGVIIFEWKDWGVDHFSGGDHGILIDIREGRGLTFSWHPDRPDYATRVDLDLEDYNGDCIIRVRESGFKNDELGLHSMLNSASGWGEALTLFKMYMEHGKKY